MDHQLVTRLVGRRKPPHQTPLRKSERRIRRRVLLAVASLTLAGLVGTGLTFWIQGYRPYVVYTGSMSPTIRPGDVVLDRPASHGYRVGDVITFRKSGSDAEPVTHRVVAVTPSGIRTKGDANRTADASGATPDHVLGSVMFTMHGLGYLVVYFREPTGIASICTIALTVILLWGMFFPSPAPSREIPPTVTASDAA